jgi:hypothetical protein
VAAPALGFAPILSVHHAHHAGTAFASQAPKDSGDRSTSIGREGMGGMALFQDKEHLLRVAVLFGGGIVAFLLLQQVLVPKGFGELGHFRTGALDDNRGAPAKFGGQAACIECHTDEAKARAAGKHAHVACEACHGALARHAADPDALKATRPDPRTLCVVCHAANVAKPTAFPQIDPKDHPEGVCTECHLPHDPGSAPEEKKK